jgi:hypothetical protein
MLAKTLTIVALLAAVVCLDCSGRGSVFQPTVPSSATSTPPLTSQAGVRLTGRVLETTLAGGRSVPGGTVFFWVESSEGGHVAVDADGRYLITGLPAGHLVRTTWIPPAALPDVHQIMPANITLAGDAEQDIRVVRLAAGQSTCASPRVLGSVFERTPAGRRALAKTLVVYTLNDWDGFDASTVTDTEGRFQFCEVPRGVARVGAGNCNDQVLPLVVEVTGDTTADFDLTTFYASCP